jgi:exonuclease SbcD
MGFRFLHLADLHLETRFGGRPDTRERLRRATLEAFERAVDYALEQRLHAVLVAGDLYDDPILSLRTEGELVRQVRRLAEGGVSFLSVCGNHDPGGDAHRAVRLGLGSGGEGDWRQRVHLFRDAAPRAVTVRDRDGRPVGVVVGAGHVSEREGSNLAAGFPALEGSLPVVGLLHTHVESAIAGADHDRYAPSTPADFRRLDYAYWALGHIHARQRIADDLPAFYAGNLQGRNPRETGAKGGYVAEAHAGAAAEPEFVRLAPVRWVRLRVAERSQTAVLSEWAEQLARRAEACRESAGEEIAVVLELAGETPLAPALRSPAAVDELAGMLTDHAGVLEVQLRPVGVTEPRDRAALRASPTVLARALALIERAASDDALLASFAPEPLARELARGEEAAYLRELLEELPEELIQRSLRGGPS